MIVIINRGTGHAHAETQGRIENLLQSHGAAVRLLVARNGSQVASFAQEAAQSDADIVVGAGGDGTIDLIAAALAGSEKILAVLPLGTFNLRTADNGHVAMINAGEVNGRTFLSRSSVGLYPLALRHREKMFRRFGRSRLIALVSGATALLRWGKVMRIRLTANPESYLFRSRFVFVCNNPQELDYFHLRGRECIDAGNFAVYLPKAQTRSGILRLGVRLLAAKTEENRDFEIVCARELRLEIEPSRVPVSFDGEVRIMESPLLYRLRVGALRVRVPPRTTASDDELKLAASSNVST